ncbi:MAG: fumarylacetoacetate hydrolase family protein [Candidatus Magnetoglobus multicellularis str. Araruama]|uniref:Fumarylacetoacetate hydrolase family protein n=1 Tax=Candidatus Magnetoglobus multicellularis str. Araruama TaxID=890399 RepID=A0A1V1P9X4_9BACT|nr:MAG: fumarylacetoacetate hydrolase family protein [Candidatus Magnetoglobus multicellularis str. Araruama]
MKLAQIYYQEKVRLVKVRDDALILLDYNGSIVDLMKKNNLTGLMEQNSIPIESAFFLPPIMHASKVIAIGLNYMDHADECNMALPKEPLIFTKFSSSLNGHNHPIFWKESITQQVDFEAELAVIIGKTVYQCSKDQAYDAVFGYTCANDVSARDLQFGDGQWVRGKSLDTFCPLGPWMVSRDEIDNPHSLDIQCRVNGQIMQKSNTDQMIFSIPDLIVFLSNHFTLYPCDIILTGTPAGVGVFRKPQVFLKAGDTVEVEIENIGILSNKAVVSNQ